MPKPTPETTTPLAPIQPTPTVDAGSLAYPDAAPSAAADAPRIHGGHARAMWAMLLAVGAFALMDSLMKLLAAHYPAIQVAAMRGISSMPLVLMYVAWRRQLGSLWRIRWPLQLLRGVANIGTLFLFSYSLKALALADAYTLFFVAPLMITALSALVLGERVRPAHWAAIGVGMVGVVVALRPDGESFLSLDALAALGAAACYAMSAILGRVLVRRNSGESLVFWTTALIAVGAGILAQPSWVPLESKHWPLIAALALTGFVGLLAITEAFRGGQASVVAPLEYTALAWGVALDWLLWRTVPDALTLLGGAIIIGSGLVLLRREH